MSDIHDPRELLAKAMYGQFHSGVRIMNMAEFQPRCDCCGRFVQVNSPGVSWCQTYTHLSLNDPTYRCSPCTDRLGVRPTNCNEREQPYHGRNAV